MRRIAFVLGIAISSLVMAQTADDALKMGQTLHGGTARFMGMGGAFGALGGDFSSISFNPAGLGVYLGSEFTFTPSYTFSSTNTNYLTNRENDLDYKLTMNNLGYVGSFSLGRSEGWNQLSFAFGYNRLADFNNQIKIEGINNTSSLADYFWDNAQGVVVENIDPFTSGLAYDARVLDPADTTYSNYLINMSLGETQRKTISMDGGIGEYVFAVGANYDHKLYIGYYMGIQSYRYVYKSNHTEFSNTPGDSITEFSFLESYTTRGTGVNFKVGAIYRPFSSLRVGLALHTPTFYGLEDEYYNTMESIHLKDGEIKARPMDYSSGYGTSIGTQFYGYSFTSPSMSRMFPFKVISSLAYVYKKIGMVSVDYEYLDYSTMRLRNGEDGYDYEDEKEMIQMAYTGAHNFRAGIEARLDMLYLRGGFAYYGSPYKSFQMNGNAYITMYSGGIGVMGDNMFFDVTYVLQNNKHYLTLYQSLLESPTAEINHYKGQILTTFGLRF